MPRKPRIHLTGGCYHVILRGNNKQAIFFDNRDRKKFYSLLQEGVERYRYSIHGFCLMTNHIHLLIQVENISLAKIMHNITFRYSRWINWRQQRIGHLFQSRYKAILVDKDNYLLQLIRYIHLNPVRAKITSRVETYLWSSHRAYLGKERLPWLTTEWVLAQFSSDQNISRKKYQQFIAQGKNETYREEFHSGTTDARILADEKFTCRIINERNTAAKRYYKIEQILDFICKKFAMKHDQLLGRSRNLADAKKRVYVVWLSTNLCASTLVQIARYFGRDPSSFARALRRLTSEDLRTLETIRNDFIQYVNHVKPDT